MEKSVSMLAVALALAFAAPALGQGQGPAGLNAPPTKVEITARDFAYDPERIVVSRGQNVDLTMKNEGTNPYNLVIKLPDSEVKFTEPVDPNGRRTLSFRAPEKAGEYEIYAPVENHRERGMAAKLVVR